MIKVLWKTGFAALALLLCVAARAADDTASPRQYDIELLVFQNLVGGDDGEIWPQDYSTWFNDTAQSPQDAQAGERGDKEVTTGGTPPSEPLNVTWLSPDNYHLKAERNTLRRSPNYRLLSYLAWRQPVLDRDHAKPLEIQPPANRDAPYVDGTVRVAVERYLHLYLDLQLHLPANVVAGQADAQAAGLPEIRLTEQRRMRSKELHYFDNPRFSVIALITPYQPPSEPAEPAPPGAATAPANGTKSVPSPAPKP